MTSGLSSAPTASMEGPPVAPPLWAGLSGRQPVCCLLVFSQIHESSAVVCSLNVDVSRNQTAAIIMANVK